MRPPRSPSRDRSDRFTGFRGYVRVPDRYFQAKRMALLSAVVLVGLWLVVEFFHPRAAAFHTHGTLANPHAAWDQDCAACHRTQGLPSFSLSDILNARGRWHDLTCTKCHAGPAHHNSIEDVGGEWAEYHNRCSNCHHDHAGRTASLTDIADSHCTDCHKKIDHSKRDRLATYHAFGTSDGHPEFRVLDEYKTGQNYTPRKLKFSHAVHMTPGMVTTSRLDGKDERSGPLTGAQLEAYSPDAVARYADPKDKEKAVQLTCVHCHQLDAEVPDRAVPANDPDRVRFDRLTALLRGQPRASLQPPRAEGAYYLPVNYDTSCKACHPTVAPGGSVPDGGRMLTGFPIPHRVTPAELAPFLRAGYWEQLEKKVAAERPAGPGQRLDPKAVVGDVTAKHGGDVDRLTASAQKWLATQPKVGDAKATGVCAKCHELTGSGTGAALTVVPLPQHTVWFEHARFNHVSHRGLTCSECHPGTDRPAAPPPDSVNEVEPVGIRGVKSCRACHAPAGMPLDDDKATAVGVRHRCTDCHRYHNGDRPLHGLGSPKRDPLMPQTLADFLKGGK